MPEAGWSVVYLSLPAGLKDRMKSDAGKDGRTLAKWIEIHFRDYYASQDQECETLSSEPHSVSSESV